MFDYEPEFEDDEDDEDDYGFDYDDEDDDYYQEGKMKKPYRKSGYMGYSEPVKEIEVDDDIEFTLSLKHLLKKHIVKKDD